MYSWTGLCEAFRSLRALTSSHRDNAASKPLIPEVEASVCIVFAWCVRPPASRWLRYVHRVLCEAGIHLVLPLSQ